MLPDIFKDWIIYRPKTEKEIKKDLKYYLELGYTEEEYNQTINSYDEAKNILDEMKARQNTAFYEFYITYSGIDSSERENADLMYSLDEILENYKNSFWKQYPQIEKRYLQLSSIEGEYSYFYDKETDALYGVDWGEMDDFVAGKLEPLFTSFYNFLEWYYSEEDS